MIALCQVSELKACLVGTTAQLASARQESCSHLKRLNEAAADRSKLLLHVDVVMEATEMPGVLFMHKTKLALYWRVVHAQIQTCALLTRLGSCTRLRS